MANQADVVVKNGFVGQRIRVLRTLPHGSIDYESTVEGSEYERFIIIGQDVSLTIEAPEGKDTKDCLIKMRSDVDVQLLNSRTASQWNLKLIPNELPPDSPMSIYIAIGEDEPD